MAREDKRFLESVELAQITGNIQACDNTWDLEYAIKQDFNYAFMNTRLNNILFD